MFYTLIKHRFFDQSERAQGPIYILKINKERNIATPDKVWGNPTQKVMRMKFYDEKKIAIKLVIKQPLTITGCLVVCLYL